MEHYRLRNIFVPKPLCIFYLEYIMYCMRLYVKVLRTRGGRCQKLTPCQIKQVPASSKIDLSLSKAKPVSNDGSTSVITWLWRGKKTPQTCNSTDARDRSENIWDKPLCRLQTQQRKRWGRCWSRDSPAACGEDPVKALVTVTHGVSMESAVSEGPHAEGGVCLKEAVILWEAHRRPGSWWDMWRCGEPMLEQSGPEDLHLMERSHARVVPEEL